jgi:hypothetical protein
LSSSSSFVRFGSFEEFSETVKEKRLLRWSVAHEQWINLRLKSVEMGKRLTMTNLMRREIMWVKNLRNRPLQLQNILVMSRLKIPNQGTHSHDLEIPHTHNLETHSRRRCRKKRYRSRHHGLPFNLKLPHLSYLNLHPVLSLADIRSRLRSNQAVLPFLVTAGFLHHLSQGLYLPVLSVLPALPVLLVIFR